MTDRVIRIRSRWVGVMVGVVLLGVWVPLGLANTPYQEGRAVVLTRERQAMMGYLRDLSGWTAVMAASLGALQGVLDEAAALSDSGRLLQGGQRGGEALERLGAVAREVDGARAPAAMGEVHRQARDALAVAIRAGQSVVACVGAPRPETIADARAQLKEAQARLAALTGLAQRQRKAISRQGGPGGR